MSEPIISTSHPAFTVHDCFLETAFEVRFQGLLRQARQARTWHVIAALPGSGKSLGIADLTHQSNSHKNPSKGTHIPLLAIRAPKNGGKGSGSHENAGPFKVVAMEKEVQTSIMHKQRFRERKRFANKTS